MKRPFFSIALLIMLIIVVPAWAASDLKIGVIDMDKILKDSKGAKKAQELLKEDFQSKQNKLVSKEKEVRKTEDELKKLEGKGNPEDVKEKRDRFTQQVKEYKRLQSDLEEEFKKDKMEMTQKVLDEIKEVVNSFAKNEKYTLILEKKQYIWATDTTDITDRIIKLYDVRN
ncbi:MAG: OmpH family outer membrane protein [Syntrophales bacterium]|jgi:outer membrane protein